MTRPRPESDLDQDRDWNQNPTRTRPEPDKNPIRIWTMTRPGPEPDNDQDLTSTRMRPILWPVLSELQYFSVSKNVEVKQPKNVSEMWIRGIRATFLLRHVSQAA